MSPPREREAAECPLTLLLRLIAFVLVGMLAAYLVQNAVAFPILQPGSRGQAVRDAQWLLRGHNRYGLFTFHHKITGRYESITASATRRAKYRLGYPNRLINGQFGPDLYALLTHKRKLPPAYHARRRKRLSQLRAGGIVYLTGACRTAPPKPYVLTFARRVAAVYGHALSCTSGRRYSYVKGTNHLSMHVYGAAADLATGTVLMNLQVGRSALIAAGMSRARARLVYSPFAYGFWQGGVNILFHTFVGGNHWNHVHVGLWKLPPPPRALAAARPADLRRAGRTVVSGDATSRAQSMQEAAGETTSGLGAWRTTYYYGMPVPDARTAAGIRAIKLELIYNGYGKGIDVTVTGFGKYAKARTIDFQRGYGLTADGIVGPRTARLLYRLRSRRLQTEAGIPADLLCKQKTLESANDPVAQGAADPGDEGIEQIHLAFHPAITLAQAWDPSFALPWATHTLKGYRVDLGDWDGAIAAWNIGETYARRWVQAGKPASGLVVNGIDFYARATTYVRLVKNAAC